ncbi:MAG: helix-turn-helix domain-containing protein [Balneolaceae bacterium]|nr:helix-turn-helix domain-containing protein [Balneolaceae bacterium]
MSVEITEYQPPEDLSNYVEFFWDGKFNIFREQILYQQVAPNGFVELVIHPSEPHCHLPVHRGWNSSPDYTIIGLFTKPYEVKFPDLINVFGIRFKPEGVYNLFGIPASVFSDKYEDMELVLGREFREFCSRLRETTDISKRLAITADYLRNMREENDRGLTYLNKAADIIRASEDINTIDELPERVYISQRQLEREFREKIGTTPKRYMRIARLNKVHRWLEAGGELPLTRVAFECGYTDQAHFIRDYKSFMGVNPSVFIKDRQQFIVNPNLSEQ